MRAIDRAAAGVIAGLAAVVMTTAPRAGHAQWSPRDPRTGLEVYAYLGAGAFSNDAAFTSVDAQGHGNLGGAVGVQAAVTYRFVPPFSVGLHFAYQELLGSEASRTSLVSATGDATAVGALALFHPLGLLADRRRVAGGRLDAYVGLGVDFVANTDATIASLDASSNTITSSVHAPGVAVPLTLGVDVAAFENMYVGAMVQWAYWSAGSRCHTDVSSATPTVLGTTSCDGGVLGAESYLFIGLGLRGHFHLFG